LKSGSHNLLELSGPVTGLLYLLPLEKHWSGVCQIQVTAMPVTADDDDYDKIWRK
jgi:hypothetical protein